MALSAAQQWWVRAGGSASNGGGYDSTVSGAGTNYADQDAAQLSLTDLATSGVVTTLTSVTGGFTSAMVGNIIRISAGTNFTAGYYCVTGYTDTNTVTLDRAPSTAAGSAGVGKLGGAFASIVAQFPSSGPAIASPLAAGHQINVRGAGSDTPSAVDYNHNSASYYSFPSGDTTNGCVRVVGYNGRPRIDSGGLLFFSLTMWHLENLKFVFQAANNPGYGVVAGSASLANVVIDQNGQDTAGCTVNSMTDCALVNTGSTAAGTLAAVVTNSYATDLSGLYIKNWRGYGVVLNSGGRLRDSIIAGCKATSRGAVEITNAGNAMNATVSGCTIDSNGGDGIKLTDANGASFHVVKNNILSNNGGYGLNFAVGTQALNDRRAMLAPDYNNYFSNTSGARNAISAGTHDLALDPQFANAAGGDYSIGANLKAAGFPGAFRGSSTTGYLDIGAVQRQEPAGGASIVLPARTRLLPVRTVQQRLRTRVLPGPSAPLPVRTRTVLPRTVVLSRPRAVPVPGPCAVLAVPRLRVAVRLAVAVRSRPVPVPGPLVPILARRAQQVRSVVRLSSPARLVVGSAVAQNLILPRRTIVR